MLEELELQGDLQLPPKQKKASTERVRGAKHTMRTAEPDNKLVGKLSEVGPVELQIVAGGEEVKLWNEYLDRHHYLGYSKPFGCTLRYFIVSGKGLLGCVLLAGAAKAIKVRDEWIGWSRLRRQQNLPWVINNTRLLIFPWVEIPHLASHVLGQLARRVRQDWQTRWGYEPLLLESFVDPARYPGTCYRAAGWLELGSTTGMGLARAGCIYTSTPKTIYVKALSKDFRQRLCTGRLQGRVIE